MECCIFMGAEDIERQAPNVFRMKVLGAEVVPVHCGYGDPQGRHERGNASLGLPVCVTPFTLSGPRQGRIPYPMMVRDFQCVIGEETKKQIRRVENRLPDLIVACVGGGSNALGMFYPFRKDEGVKLVGVEAAGKGLATGLHSASITAGSIGVLHGNKTYLLQDENGQIRDAYSIAAGLDYPGVGPEHGYLHSIGRAAYVAVDDAEATEAFKALCRHEGIIPAMESAHAVAFAMKVAPKLAKNKIVVINLSGRGDKDAAVIAKQMEM